MFNKPLKKIGNKLDNKTNMLLQQLINKSSNQFFEHPNRNKYRYIPFNIPFQIKIPKNTNPAKILTDSEIKFDGFEYYLEKLQIITHLFSNATHFNIIDYNQQSLIYDFPVYYADDSGSINKYTAKNQIGGTYTTGLIPIQQNAGDILTLEIKKLFQNPFSLSIIGRNSGGTNDAHFTIVLNGFKVYFIGE